ncbi:BLUF domain-containing protein [Hymenobacter properus]|uniref:BLUF domain-containing protein n=1 Tax=Hymenobacter properus TaxID=2791026 RepID=A0A931BH66_9BACT|nr:BLUF domain-containing protein [Hymenobacter properus]MBF9143494.1 BLUF domain-containing protein [Hymenobacter properus]MBR7722307.1 BLUF domain-containing protein [Microvirga sp. SRT04]
MHHIIYMSQATTALTDDKLAALLAQARRDNEERGVTGLLLYGDKQFMQVMEGEAEVLAPLYDHIAKDPRHTGLIKLADKAVEQRSFADWSMAFRAVPAEQFASLAGYVSPEALRLQVPGLSGADALLLEMARQFVLPSNES